MIFTSLLDPLYCGYVRGAPPQSGGCLAIAIDLVYINRIQQVIKMSHKIEGNWNYLT